MCPDFEGRYRLCDPMEPCCQSVDMVKKVQHDGWTWKQDDGVFTTAYVCVKCGKLWFKDGNDDRYYAHLAAWSSDARR